MDIHRRRSQQRLEVGEADRRLDRLIAQEQRARARSTPPEGRQPGTNGAALGSSGAVAGALEADRGVVEVRSSTVRALGDAGQNLPLANPRDVPVEVSRPHANHGDGLAGGARGSEDLQRPDQVEGRANLPDPPPGVYQRDWPYDGLPQGFDPGQGGWHADSYAVGFVANAFEETGVTLQAGMDRLCPRRLEFSRPHVASMNYGPPRVLPQGLLQGNPAGQVQQAPQVVNAFWTPETRRLAVENPQGDPRGLQHPTTAPVTFGPTAQLADQGSDLGAGHQRDPPGDPRLRPEPQGAFRPTMELRAPPVGAMDQLDVDRVRQRILQEAEEAFQREIRRLRDGSAGDAGSYHTVTSGMVSGPGVQANPCSPQGTQVQPMIQPGVSPPGPPAQGGNLQASPPVGYPQRSEGTTGFGLESLRSQELPALPPAGPDSALMFGDWLALIGPLMCDISPSARMWWNATVRDVSLWYDQWLQSTPLERLRMRPESGPMDETGMRLEQRAASMLLGSLPEMLRKDIISSRRLSSVAILFKLHTVYQPGGGAERGSLLRNLTEIKVGHSVNDLLMAVRNWRRWVARSCELHLTLPDPLILMQVLGKAADSLAKHGGTQVSYRLSSVRQELQLDHRPSLGAALEYAEYIQAESEELALMVGSPAPKVANVPSGAPIQPPVANPPGLKAMAVSGQPEGQKGSSLGKAAQPCKFWGTAGGCRRGESCGYQHSWENLEKKDRCYVCSAEGHFSKECPTKKEKSQPKKVAKVKGTKETTATEPQKDEKRDGKKTEGTGTTSTQPTKESDGGTGGGGSSTGPPSTDQAGELLQEATALLKSLRSLKAMKVKQIGPPKDQGNGRVALLDGGATHGLRRAYPHEVPQLEKVEVELAAGSAWLFKHPRHRTLLSVEDVEVIIPLHRVVSLGYRIEWSSRGCRIFHGTRGPIECVLRNGCPVLPEAAGLELLAEMEAKDGDSCGLPHDVVSWWKSRFPSVPDGVLKFMDGQDMDDVDPERVPWNRRQRRTHWRSRGVILNLFSGKGAKPWKEVEQMGYVMINLDIADGAQFNLNHAGVWGYLTNLCRHGRVCGILGGPPCRSVSRLRHRAPGPRPLRDRHDGRWGLDGLEAWEEELVWGDSALFLKQIALWFIADDHKLVDVSPFFLLENPQDPHDYIPEEAEREQYPSYWSFPEIRSCITLMNGKLVKFDQGPMGHRKRKPTTILIANAPGLVELQGVEGEGQGELSASTLEERLAQSKGWAAWAPGLVRAIKESLKMYLAKHMECLSHEVNEDPHFKKMDLASWRAHIQQGHQPFRRDCRVCMTTMGIDQRHRRHLGGSSGTTQSYCMSVDVVGPFIEGYDLGLNEMGKYLLVSTVSVPDLRTEEGMTKGPQPEEEHLEDEDTVEPDENLGGLLEDPEEVPQASVEAAEKLNAKNAAKIFAEPVKHQNLTLVEVMLKRDTDSILAAMSRQFAKFRMMGLPIYRIHSDRATPFLTAKMARWCEQKEVVQSMTGGDDGPGNGRVEAEIGQLKRRLRATLAQSGLPQTFWPCCARHVGEARLRQQLTRLGVPCRPMPIFASNVVVKTKRWHKSGQLSDPFRPMQLMGPSPLMTNGWVVRTEDQIQHARAVVVTDPLSHTAHVELQVGDNPGRPTHRHHGKQPLDGVENPLKNLFPIEATSMAELHPEGAPDDPGLLPAPDPLPDLQLEEDDYSPESPVEELALRQLQARGESFGSCESGLKKCGGCGLDQPLGKCRFCDDESAGPGEQSPTRWHLDRGQDDLIHEQNLRDHWNLKRLWSQQLATPAVGDQAGREHGGFLEWLERDLRQMEEDLEIQGEEIHGARLAALQSGVVDRNEEVTQPAAVLQTYTVPLSAVRKELSEWRSAMAAELKSLLETTKAIRKVEESELVKFPNYKDLEMAPAKVVATVKAPSGRRKVRVVICGNLLEKIHQGQEDGGQKSAGGDETSRFAQYAGGVDGTTLRCVLRKSAANDWAIATTDVRTAFLLAPRQNRRLLVCHPPRVLIEAGLCTPTERWVVDGAMYGLPESPKDWGCYRDVHVSTFKWALDGRQYQLRRTPEPNVWYVIREGRGDDDPDEVCGFVTIYVDDILVAAPEEIACATMQRIKQEWTCSEVEWVSSSSWTKFCGLELRREGRAILVGQPSYVKELLERHDPQGEQVAPMPSQLDETPEPDPEVKDIRLAQAIVGELLWASVRTRPDLCYGVAWMGRMVTKCPKRVLQYGKHMVSYLKRTSARRADRPKFSGR